uniref:Aldehyde dehydrogenase n=1 Tax=Albugo laibachii Nc14 TaxID=890382 RepID=F0WCV6_9STRA|nr:aldehyde dehydrogenase putative [Albugo laibachii Nc14]|eukprot:CCA19027.1 aldehyde dehydrogenase putative [Albugo laibachii Nc14]
MELPPQSEEIIELAVQELRQQYSTGATRNDLNLRETLLHQLETLLIQGQQLLEGALLKDLHKHSTEYYLTEMTGILSEIQYQRRNFRKWAQPQWQFTNLLNLPGSSYVHPEPFGVVCIIGSWNFPVYLLLMPLVGAISSGNCTLLRLPDDDTCTHTVKALVHLFAKYVDTRYVRVIHGGIEETKIVLQQKFDLILGTGSETLGRIVSRAAAEHLTPVILELGGKSPCVVDETAEIELTARRIVWGAFLNAGQLCLRPDYVLVDKRIGDQLVDAIIQQINQFFGLDPLESDSYGRVIHKRSFDRLAAILKQDAKFVIHGGKLDAEKLYISPTLLNFKGDLLEFQRSSAMEKELFGPILPIFYYDTFEQVFTLIQSRPKSLTMALFSSDKDRQRALLSNTSRCREFRLG